jgi:hypothetical protein
MGPGHDEDASRGVSVLAGRVELIECLLYGVGAVTLRLEDDAGVSEDTLGCEAQHRVAFLATTDAGRGPGDVEDAWGSLRGHPHERHDRILEIEAPSRGLLVLRALGLDARERVLGDARRSGDKPEGVAGETVGAAPRLSDKWLEGMGGVLR